MWSSRKLAVRPELPLSAFLHLLNVLSELFLRSQLEKDLALVESYEIMGLVLRKAVIILLSLKGFLLV